MRIPFFLYWKGKIVPGESDHVIALYDFLRTAADLAGVAVPKTDGISLLATLSGKPDLQPAHDYLYWENGTSSNQTQSIRKDNWWAFRSSPSDPVELYDITKDIECLHNPAKDNPAIVSEIKEIFVKAHADSEWYINPGDIEESIAFKGKRAVETGALQKSKRPDAMFT